MSNNAINRLQIGMSPILQLRIDKDLKKTFSSSTLYLSLYKVLYGYNYGNKLNFDVIKVGMALVKMIVHVVIKTHWCFLVIFLDYKASKDALTI